MEISAGSSDMEFMAVHPAMGPSAPNLKSDNQKTSTQLAVTDKKN